MLPDGSTMSSMHEADLDIPSLPPAARKAHIFPGLTAGPLISIGQLCDSGCTPVFTPATKVSIKLNNQIILTGTPSPVTRLWNIDLPMTPVPKPASNATIQSATPAQLVAFSHAALFSPALSTLQSALDKNLLPDFPGLSAASLRKHPPFSAPMIKGHLYHTQKKQCSTQATVTADPAEPADVFPAPASEGQCTHMCCVACMHST
jgi:hypothetical protein